MEKFLQELENTQDIQLLTIGNYLKEQAEQDETFKAKLDNEEKSLNQCFDYIKGEAQKQATNNCAMVDDEVVFGWAVHYYDETNEKLGLIKKEIEKTIIPKQEISKKQIEEKKITLPKIEQKTVKKQKTKLSDLQEALF